jgi:uncharacterized protein (DUF3820 family)
MKSKMTDVEAMNMIMPFGKDTHKGKTLEEVPSSYLNWVEEQDWAGERHPKLIEAIGKVLRWRTLHDEHF